MGTAGDLSRLSAVRAGTSRPSSIIRAAGAACGMLPDLGVAAGIVPDAKKAPATKTVPEPGKTEPFCHEVQDVQENRRAATCDDTE